MTYIPLTGASSGGSKPSNWTVRERLRNITKALTAGSSLDLRFAEKFFYQQDNLYPAMELMATHSRTSSAWYPNWDFKSGSEVGRLVEYGADERRYGDYGALDEGASTNQIRNPRGEGAEAGTPGTNPSNWTIDAAGATKEIVATGSQEGWPYFRVRFSGTPSNNIRIYFEPSTQVTAADGEDWSISAGIRLVSGDLTNIDETVFALVERTSGGGLVNGNVSDPLTVETNHRRSAYSVTLSGGASTERVRPEIRFSHTSGAVDFTVDIYAPQLEQAAAPTSPILPTAGTPAAATRAADVVTGVTTDRASRGWYDTQWDYTNGGVCGDLLEFLPGVPRVGPQGLLVEEGTTNHIRNPRGEGAVAGSPGTFPTNWSAVLNGTTMNVQGSGTEDGWHYVDIEVTGTATGSFSINLEGSGVAAAVNGQDWTQSAGLRLMSGDFTNAGTPRLVLRQRTGALSALSEFHEDVSIDGLHRRFFLSAVTNDPSVAFVQPTLKWAGAGGAVQFVIRIYPPQLEQKAYPTSVVLPEAGSPAAATRAADDIERGNGDWASDTSFSVFGEFVLNTVAQDGSPFSIASGGSDRTDILACEGGDLKFRYRSNGVTDASQIIRSAQVAETVRSAIGVDASEVAVSVSGAATQTYTPTDVLPGASLSFGKAWPSAATAGSFFIKSARYWPYRFSNSELAALVA